MSGQSDTRGSERGIGVNHFMYTPTVARGTPGLDMNGQSDTRGSERGIGVN